MPICASDICNHYGLFASYEIVGNGMPYSIGEASSVALQERLDYHTVSLCLRSFAALPIGSDTLLDAFEMNVVSAPMF